MPKVEKLSSEEKEEAKRMYLSGQDTPVVAKHFGVHATSMRWYLRELGTPMRKGRPRKEFSKDVVEAMVARYAGGESARALAEHFDTSSEAVSCALRLRGVVLRNGALTGEKHALWRGGRTLTNGARGAHVYALVLLPLDSPFAAMRTSPRRYCLEHRLVMAKHLGRPLERHETVHHIDGNTLNNALENLQLRQGQHGKGAAFVCKDCGSRNVAAEELAEERPS
jgi:transposase-like protein